MERVCPWWLGYFLASPLRRFIHDPVKILKPFITEGMTVLDIGSAMGYFSIPMAQMAGEKGKVICVDVQEKMLAGLKRRAAKAGVLSRIDARLAAKDSLHLDDVAEKVDFALAFAMVHEVPDQDRLFREIHSALKKDGKLLFAEPSGHVTLKTFQSSLVYAEKADLSLSPASPAINITHAAILTAVK